MLVELRKYDNLGTPKYFFELFTNIVTTNSIWKNDDIEKLFYNKIIDDKTVFDGCLPFANILGLILYDESHNIFLNQEIIDSLTTQENLQNKIVEFILEKLKEDINFLKIFSQNNISFDIVYKQIQINNSAFDFKFSNFKQLLLDFEVITVHPNIKSFKFLLNNKYKRLIDAKVLPEVRKKMISVEQLKKDLEAKQKNGIEGEKFVLEFEKKRLHDKAGIIWVAEYSVAEGYDILSFDKIESKENDRYIEVKSFSTNPYFYWSKNEIDFAKKKSENYFLYLIDRDKISQSNYEPIIIQNPILHVFNNTQWIKEIENYRIELIK